MLTAVKPAIRTQYRTIDGLTIRFAESEERDASALLLSPWPESLLAYDQVWPRLAEDTHLVAVDLPGFGHSEGRASLFGPRTMGEFLVRLADEFGLDHPHVVGPDIGTTTALFAAAGHPGRFRSLVVGNGAASYPLQLGGVFQDWVAAPYLGALRGLDPRRVVSAVLSGLERYQLPEEVREDYLSAYVGRRFVESVEFVRTFPRELRVLADLLPGIGTPVHIIGAMWDSMVPPSNARYLHRRLPNAKLSLLDGGHFPWEDLPDTYADLITTWWAGGYAKGRPQ